MVVVDSSLFALLSNCRSELQSDRDRVLDLQPRAERGIQERGQGTAFRSISTPDHLFGAFPKLVERPCALEDLLP
jgi:hypothetical protein